MAKTQWHPLFAELLKLLLGDYYDIQTEVPVSELPRRGDFLVVRRQAGPPPPFEALWGYLREWNVIEFKGMTDNAEIGDLELLVSVGTGLTVRLNEARQGRDLGPLMNRQVAFWYVAPVITEAFASHPRAGAMFQYQTDGVWSGQAFGHLMYLVSVRELPRTVDSLPLQLLDDAVVPSLAEVFAGNQPLAERFAGWLIQYRPDLWKEVVTMNPTVPTPLSSEEIARLPVVRNIFSVMEAEEVAKVLLEKLSPEQAHDLIRRLEKSAAPPPAEGPVDPGKDI